MPDIESIERFLEGKHLAFVGASRDPKQFANTVYRHLRDGGRTLYPVNAAGPAVLEGDRCYASLADVPDPVDGVVVMVPSAGAADVVRNAVERHVPRVWLHRGIGPGSDSPEAVALCREHGIEVIDGACPLMFAPPVTGIHKLHGRLIRRRFRR